MNRHLVAALTVLSLSACATSGTDSDAMVANDESARTASDAAVVEPEGSAVLEDVEVPKVPKTDVVSENAGMRCTFEKPTGSHRLVKVCRTRGQIEERRTEDQEFIRKVQRTASPAGSN